MKTYDIVIIAGRTCGSRISKRKWNPGYPDPGKR